MIGFVGLGAMGGPMARRLASLGHRLVVHDLDVHAVQSAVAAGATAAASPKDLADRAELVFTCLPSLSAIESVVLGSGGLREGGAMKVLIDCSTTGSDFARGMASALAQRGIQFVDAPITGNVTNAGDGTLGIMCSGPKAALAAAQPAMEALASTALVYLGEANGRAQWLKLLNNLLSATGMAVSCEAFVLGVKAGLAPETMLERFNAGEASSSATRNKFARCVLARRFDFGARMAITAKDTALTVGEAEALGVPMWIGSSVQQVWKYAASQGGAQLDGTALITFLEPWAGVEVRAGANAAPGVEGSADRARLLQLLDGSLASVLLAAACESYVAGSKAGLDALTMRQILGIETGRNAASAHILPERVATRTFDHGKTLGQAHEELARVADEARRLGVTTWILDKARLLYGLAVQLRGADADITRLATLYETWAGAQVRRTAAATC